MATKKAKAVKPKVKREVWYVVIDRFGDIADDIFYVSKAAAVNGRLWPEETIERVVVERRRAEGEK